MKLLKFSIYTFLLVIFVSCSSQNIRNDSDKDSAVVMNTVPYKTNSDSLSFSSSNFLAAESFDFNTDVAGNNTGISEINVRCQKKDIASGLKKASEIYSGYNRHPSYWNAIGVCFLSSNRFFQAKLYFNRGLEISNNYAPIFNNLGVMYVLQKDYELALESFKKGHQFNQKSQVLNLNLGLLYLAFSRGDKAIKYLDLLESNPNYENNIFRAKGIAYAQQSKYLTAVKVFKRVENLDSLASLYYAKSLSRIGEKQAAKKLLDDVNITQSNPLYGFYYKVQRAL